MANTRHQPNRNTLTENFRKNTLSLQAGNADTFFMLVDHTTRRRMYTLQQHKDKILSMMAALFLASVFSEDR